MTYRDAMAALQQKAEALQEELETLRRDASSDTRAALERAFALEVAVQDAKAAASIAHLEKEREVASLQQQLEVAQIHEALEFQLAEERKLRDGIESALRDQIRALEAELAALKQDEE